MANSAGRNRFYLWIIGAMIVAALITLLVRAFISPEALEQDSDVIGNYLQVIGGFYALVIAFVIFVVWTQYSDAERNVDKEVGDLHAIVRLSYCMDQKGQSVEILTAVRNYIDTVINDEWPELAHASISPKALAAWHELMTAIRSTPTQSDRDNVVFGDMLDQLNDLSDTRDERISVSHTRIPWVLWHLLIFASVILLIPFFLISVKSPLTNILITASACGAIIFLLLVVRNLDNPFKGVFNLEPDPFIELRRTLDEEQAMS